MCEQKKSISKLTNLFSLNPQIHDEFEFKKDNKITDSNIKRISKDIDQQMNGKGRVVIRKSGTEPIIRIMVEGNDLNFNRNIINNIKSSLKTLNY